jgi:pimeloyl-[acyl-carrier protein] methyl ester esterase
LFERGEPALSVLEAGLDVLDRYDLRDALPMLPMPSLWVAGRRDRLVPPGAMRWAAQRAPDARYLELPGGHAPFLAHAEEIADAVRELAATRPG